ncbi:PREDICTED: lysM domain-containing protein ARB_03442-like isoform X2 [Ipomoea nil]|uniref:lysM domain-containing protein ARB_03442-like isoform X2 n=1 Tax=Ipomoea nil TaxID=35883 RepID=UPI00090152BE|nr:PREDICTED: lysM domain-containing protein ARB_03442-like isoform X2 [Ipomoea nil]
MAKISPMLSALSFLLILLAAVGKADAKAECNQVYGQEFGDTCTSIADKFHLSLDSFLALNPNINCNSIFVGEWLCIG